ncbi:MAG: STAS domain-containing protein [Candidatus Muirbacterium halophilum]|nr:STAS domain-containing protein [Candidatus Muirbacterium halophilum]
MALFEEIKRIDDNIELKLNDNINSETIDEFEKKIKSLVEDGFLKILLDFKDVEFISSQGLGILVINYKPVAEKGGYIALINLNDSITRVMEITRLDKVLKIIESIDELDD